MINIGCSSEDSVKIFDGSHVKVACSFLFVGAVFKLPLFYKMSQGWPVIPTFSVRLLLNF